MRNLKLGSLTIASTIAVASPAIIHSVYANNLTGLIPDLHAALDVVSRELVGYIPSVARDSGAERAALGQSIPFSVTNAAVASDVTPAMNTPEPTDETPDVDQMMITKARQASFGFTGEEQRGLNTGAGYLSLQAQMIAQRMRVLTNEIEADLALEAALNASRAWGVAGTTPFATDLKDMAQVRKILDDNGAPGTGRSFVMNTSTGAALRSLKDLTSVADAGSSMTLNQGQLLDLQGFAMKETGQPVSHIKGTSAGATTDGTGYGKGETVINLGGAGTGAIKRGDVVTFAGDAHKYIAAADVADVSAGGAKLTIAGPGLQIAIPAAATAITVGNSYEANVAFSPDAIQLITRAPALPVEGDIAIDSMMITDPRSGLTFEARLYAGYRKIRVELAMAWGVKAVKSSHIAMLLG